MAASMQKTPPGITMFATYFVIGINQGCMFIYLGIMPFLFTKYGIDPVTFSYIMSICAFLTLLSSPVLGRIADVFGSRTVLILSTLSASAALFTMGMASGVSMLLISRGVSLLMDIMPAAQMTITDIVPEANRDKYLGKIMIPMSAGMIVGPTLGGTLSNYVGPQGTLMLTCLATMLCTILILIFIPHTQKSSSGNAAELKKGGIDWSRLGEFFHGDIPYLFIMRIISTLPIMVFIMSFHLAGMNFFKLTPQGNGMVVSCMGLFNMFNNGFMLGFLSKRFDQDQLMRWTPVVSIASYFALSQVTEVWQLLVILFPINLCSAIMDNQIMTRLTKSVDKKDTGTMVGMATAVFHFSNTISPIVGGILMNTYGWSAIGQFGCVVSILMASLSVVKHR